MRTQERKEMSEVKMSSLRFTELNTGKHDHY